MKKSISFKEYRKRAADFDHITDGKNEEEVEELVIIFIKRIKSIY